MSRYFVSTAAFIAVLAATLHAQDAQPAPAINQADTAWMLVSTALVLLMTPALAFFYGGLVRSKNALNTMMMSFIALGVRRHRCGRSSATRWRSPPAGRSSAICRGSS